MNGTIESRVPYVDYRSVQALNISTLKEMKRSGKHCRYYQQHPKQTKPLTLGTAVHCKVLEPERFAGSYRIWERRTESGRIGPRQGKVWDAFEQQAAADKVEVLTFDEADEAARIAEAVRGDPEAMKYLELGEPEVTMQWDMQGRPCKARVDWLTIFRDTPVLVGLKSSRDCRPFYFGKQAAQLGYHMSWAWYLNGYVTIAGKKPKVIEIVVENAPPYDVAVYHVPEDVLLQGEEDYMNLLPLYTECESTGVWPGASPRESDISLPTWAYPGAGDIKDLGLEGFE